MSDMDMDMDMNPGEAQALQGLIKAFANDKTIDNESANETGAARQIISLEDLGLSNVKDPLIRKSVKFMKKEERVEAAKRGKSQKLAVPLSKRQQDVLLRAAAYEKTNETLDRWNDTVKKNRRADHLVFPLAQTQHDAGLDNSELLPFTSKVAGSELEQSIMAIMEESGLGPSAKHDRKDEAGNDQTVEPSISKTQLKEIWTQRRKEREAESREQKRAKRIKKIKSKTYRRINRKARIGEAEAEHEQMVEAGEIDSEEEREVAARRRALERVGARHKESKWAKMAKSGRAVWDDDYRAGLTDMARRDEELRRRVEGRTGGSDDGSGADDDDDDVGSSDEEEEDNNNRLLKQLDELGTGLEDHPQSKLMSMKFMQRGEAERKKANDDLIAEMRRELDPEAESAHNSEADSDDGDEIGRQVFGATAASNKKPFNLKSAVASIRADALSTVKPVVADHIAQQDIDKVDGSSAWATAGKLKRKRKADKSSSSHSGLLLDASAVIAQSKTQEAPDGLVQQVIQPRAKTTNPNHGIGFGAETSSSSSDDDDSDDSESPNSHLPPPRKIQQHLLANAFAAGEDVVAQFRREKEAVASEDDEKIIDKTLPGWGAWTGDGISKRMAKRNKGKVLVKQEGVKKTDRKDAKLDRVIVKEGKVKKNERYLATQLPHPFESRHQYERSLRMPVGAEWMTKESLQDATKPRIIVKQGLIAPMARPTI